jgi:hypothetical protein
MHAHLHISHASILTILVSAVFQWFLGAAWYSPALFAKPWMAALGIRPDGEKKGFVFAMICSLIASLILSFVLWHMVSWAEATTWGMGAFIGFLCWLGFIAAPSFPQGLYERRPAILFLINTGYWLVGMLVTGAVVAIWR